MIGRLILQMCDHMDTCVLCPSPRPEAEKVLRQELEDVPRCADCSKTMRGLKKILFSMPGGTRHLPGPYPVNARRISR